MKILSIDCASARCAVAAWEDGAVRALASEGMERGQDARLMPLILEVLGKASWTFAALDRLAVTKGPGSFTGIRIGLAAARGIGFAAGKPVFGIDRFALHAAQHADEKALMVVLDSRRAELYVRMAGSDSMLTPQEIAEILAENPALRIAGDGEAALGDIAPRPHFLELTEPEVVTCAALAAQAKADDPVTLPRPYYLRAPDVTIAAQAASGCCA